VLTPHSWLLFSYVLNQRTSPSGHSHLPQKTESTTTDMPVANRFGSCPSVEEMANAQTDGEEASHHASHKSPLKIHPSCRQFKEDNRSHERHHLRPEHDRGKGHHSDEPVWFILEKEVVTKEHYKKKKKVPLNDVRLHLRPNKKSQTKRDGKGVREGAAGVKQKVKLGEGDQGQHG